MKKRLLTANVFILLTLCVLSFLFISIVLMNFNAFTTIQLPQITTRGQYTFPVLYLFLFFLSIWLVTSEQYAYKSTRFYVMAILCLIVIAADCLTTILAVVVNQTTAFQTLLLIWNWGILPAFGLAISGIYITCGVLNRKEQLDAVKEAEISIDEP